MRIGSASTIAAVAVGLLLAVALAGELAWGTWLSRDPIDGLAIPRDLRIAVSVRGAQGAEFVSRRDHWGFRGAVGDPAKVAIVTLGGNQSAVPDDRTWPATMASVLGGQGREIVVADAGLDGQSTIGLLRVLEAWLPAVPGLKPRFVIASVGIGDVHAEDSAVDRLEHPDSWARLRARSVLLRLAAGQPRRDYPAVDWAAAEWTDRPSRPDHTPEVAAYKDRLGRMAEAIHAMGAVPVFITEWRGDARIKDGRVMGLATANGLNGVDQHRLLARFNAATLAVCQEKGLLCLDLAREIRFVDDDFLDATHPTAHGAEMVGRWLAGKLAGLV